MSSIKTLLVMVAGIGGVTLICPVCETVVSRAAAQSAPAVSQVTDTATVRMHISGMTCGTCPLTARVALKKLNGVYDAKVTLADSVGVVRYNPKLTAPAQIASHLTKLTGFKAAVLPDSLNGVRGIG